MPDSEITIKMCVVAQSRRLFNHGAQQTRFWIYT
jgi:hypothetical protein